MAESKKRNNDTKILHCSPCKSHIFQDKRYGNKMRVHNGCAGPAYRCTICSNTRN